MAPVLTFIIHCERHVASIFGFIFDALDFTCIKSQNRKKAKSTVSECLGRSQNLGINIGSPENKHIQLQTYSYPLKNTGWKITFLFKWSLVTGHSFIFGGVHPRFSLRQKKHIHQGSVCPLELLGERKLAEVVSYPTKTG